MHTSCDRDEPISMQKRIGEIAIFVPGLLAAPWKVLGGRNLCMLHAAERQCEIGGAGGKSQCWSDERNC